MPADRSKSQFSITNKYNKDNLKPISWAHFIFLRRKGELLPRVVCDTAGKIRSNLLFEKDDLLPLSFRLHYIHAAISALSVSEGALETLF